MSNEWKSYINENGDFEFPKYLHRTLNELMKATLDLGTLVCQDQAKLRAYKERVKSSFRQKWFDIASSLEFFDLVEPCTCRGDEFCTVCGGSRFVLDETLSMSEIQQFAMVYGADMKADLAEKLQRGLQKALMEVNYGQAEEITDTTGDNGS
jgi:hypothetical protein